MLALIRNPWMLVFAFAFALAVAFAFMLATPALGAGPFRDLSFDQALAAAAKEDRVVFVDFYTTWCAPCKKLDEITWKDERVTEWLGENTVALKIDAEKQVELAQRFRVEGFPTLIFVGPDGTELGRLVGYLDPEDFLKNAPSAREGVGESDRFRKALEEKPNDYLVRMQLGSALAREGRYEEALAEFIWCYDEGLEFNPFFMGVRNSFLVGDFIQLGRKFPPALDALRERAESAREKLLSGEGGLQESMDVSSILAALDEHHKLLELWDELKAADLTNSMVEIGLFQQVLDLMLENERYAEILEQIGRLDLHLNGLVFRYEMVVSLNEDEDSSMEFMLTSCLTDLSKTYQALLGAEDERAPSFAEDVLEFNSSPEAYSLLVLAAANAEDWAVARELLTEGYASADLEGKRLLRGAERTLPQEERLPRAK